MIIRFPESKITNDIYDSVQTNYLNTIVYYVIDSKFRTSVRLSSWLEEQVLNPGEQTKAWADAIANYSDTDEQMIAILRYVRLHLIYISDTSVWDMPEYWQPANVTADLGTGDCEDGAILIYCLARLKGIPHYRLLLFCGNVTGGGHCWLGYKPNGLPLDWTFLDWCYWYDNSSIDSRHKFSVLDSSIFEYDEANELTPIAKSNYLLLWFGFNEKHSYKRLTYEYR